MYRSYSVNIGEYTMSQQNQMINYYQLNKLAISNMAISNWVQRPFQIIR